MLAEPLRLPKYTVTPKAAITLVFDRIDFAEAYRYAEPLAHVGVGFALRRALAPGFVQHETDYVL